jgi:alkanesulfonate monooxygenase SsuD/methylene tetrahydromethanopterin reductase-like flavin-dependent oxidoreductase (luciferase family)
MADPHPLRFGWLSPCIGNRWSDHKPIVVEQAKTILPTVDELFDSMWIADHFYGFDEKTDPFVEAWTSLTWLATKFPTDRFARSATDAAVTGLGISWRHSRA